MKTLFKSLLAAVAVGGLAGCATYDYGYGYSYDQPYYGYYGYDNSPYTYDYGYPYYDYGPGYYYDYGAPSVGFSLGYYDHGDHHGGRRYYGGHDRGHFDHNRGGRFEHDSNVSRPHASRPMHVNRATTGPRANSPRIVSAARAHVPAARPRAEAHVPGHRRAPQETMRAQQ